MKKSKEENIKNGAISLFSFEDLAICFHGKSLFLKADPKMRYTVDGVMQCPHVRCIDAKPHAWNLYFCSFISNPVVFNMHSTAVHMYGL